MVGEAGGFAGQGPEVSPVIQISMPVHGGVHPGTVTDLVELVTASAKMWPRVADHYGYGYGGGLKFSIFLTIERNSALSKQRWALVEKARARGATHLLWLDADMRFHPDLLMHLLKHQKPIVGCNYRMRQGAHIPIVKVRGKNVESTVGGRELERVDELGFGVLLTEAQVFDKIKRPFDIVQEDDGFWPDESQAFSARAREAGFDLWCDHWQSLCVGHVGEETYTFEEDIPQVIRVEP